jgi:hypothetical protein
MKSKIAKISAVTLLTASLIAGTSVVSQAAPVSSTNLSAAVATTDAAAISAYKAAKAEYQAAMVAYKAAKADFKAQKAAYRAAMGDLKPALTAYAQAKKVIGQTFRTTINAAKATYQAAIAGVTDPEALLNAKAAFDAAKNAAASTRAAALAALGAAPVKPAAPAKPTKPVKPSRP